MFNKQNMRKIERLADASRFFMCNNIDTIMRHYCTRNIIDTQFFYRPRKLIFPSNLKSAGSLYSAAGSLIDCVTI